MTQRDVPEELRPHVRTAFVPRVEDGDGGPKDSKLGGTPWISEGTTWPVCPNCERPMQLLLQLDVVSLPAPQRFGETGLLQLFYCTSGDPLCEVDCEAYFHFAKSVECRRVDPSAPGAPGDAEIQDPLAPKHIVGWDAHADYPNWEEMEELDVELDEAQLDAVGEHFPLGGEKLWGWPRWVQSIEYPECRKCGATMQLVFQIDSNGMIDIQWGDLGVAHLTQCPEHPNELAFGWACS